jgi:hypothetical protein
MFAENDTNIFVTIKLGKIIIMNKVGTRIKKGESFAQVAKELRKNVSNWPKNHGIIPEKGKINPSVLSWGIFKSVDDNSPVMTSKNWQ